MAQWQSRPSTEAADMILGFFACSTRFLANPVDDRLAHHRIGAAIISRGGGIPSLRIVTESL